MEESKRLFWIISGRCNIACRYCYYNTGLETRIFQNIDLPKAKQIIQQIPARFNEVVFTGGETLLCAELFTLVQWCKEQRLKVSVLTNGILLNEANCQNFLKYHVDSVSVSLDSLDTKTNDFLRGRTADVLKGISQLIKASKQQKTTIQILQTITRKNISSIRPLVNFCKKNRISLWLDPVEINSSLPLLNELDLRRCTSAEMKLLAKEMDYWCSSMKSGKFEEYAKNVLRLIKKEPLKNITCPMGTNHFVLDVDGNVYPCFLRKDLRVGTSEKISQLSERKELVTAPCVRLGCICLTIS